MSSPSAARPPPLADPHRRLIFRDKEVQFFGDRARAHEGFEHFADFAEPIAGFLFGLGADPHFRRFVVQQAGRGLDQEIVVAVDISRVAKLPHQHHGALRQIVGQQRRAVAAVVGLAVLGSATRRRRAAIRRWWSSACSGCRKARGRSGRGCGRRRSWQVPRLKGAAGVTASARGRRAIWRRSTRSCS